MSRFDRARTPGEKTGTGFSAPDVASSIQKHLAMPIDRLMLADQVT
ncbi:MAG: hypothetical protein VYD57_15015 [Pseudomonadota bacterium]|nr:hypothetical protein [Pseudomonadota bacterium]